MGSVFSGVVVHLPSLLLDHGDVSRVQQADPFTEVYINNPLYNCKARFGSRCLKIHTWIMLPLVIRLRSPIHEVPIGASGSEPLKNDAQTVTPLVVHKVETLTYATPVKR